MITNPLAFTAGIVWLTASILYYRRFLRKNKGSILFAFLYLILGAWMLIRGIT